MVRPDDRRVYEVRLQLVEDIRHEWEKRDEREEDGGSKADCDDDEGIACLQHLDLVKQDIEPVVQPVRILVYQDCLIQNIFRALVELDRRRLLHLR